ncbi:hypothetical protein BFN02_03940 [Staphylococcus equorum]|nr:hypothetical protein BFN02_03940 [Staphylococcus equorum]
MTNEVKNVPKLRFSDFNEEWEDNLVGNIFEFKNGLNKGKEYFGYGLPIVNFKDVFHNRGIKGEYLNGKVDVSEKELQNYSVRKGDVFFTRTSETIEEIGYPTVMMDEIPKAVFSGFVLRARPKKNIKLVDDKFKRYVFFTYSFRKEMITKSSITTRALTSGTAINKMKVVYPTSIEEQNKIGDFFSKLDRQIELEEQKLSLLEEEKRGYMQKIFLQELRFKDENGNDYPEWKHETLNELNCYFTDGNYGEGYPKSDDMSNFEEGVAFLRGSNLKKGRIVLDNANYISKEKHNELVSGHLYLGDIVIAVRGSLGAVGYVEKNIEGQNINSQLAIIRTLDTKIVSRFLIYYLMSNFGQKELLSKVSGTALKQLPLKEIKSFKTPLPENKEQDKISDFFNKLDKIINKQIKKIDGLKLRKKGFLQKMFV